ncbi:rop guanine nucleotide exchange factor 14-like isoform X2 [Lotus japonicus]|uniref:rop guanine nucleotide exchange factor 14-like isoform X2 n=1 Tax=Lotus japonicus TaxID=34305 RepID=UPI00258F745B|nr:rop guanine nucleotide exchange factor 14-like isoform X2 [Lotus japonicus]XP_057448813.1 rop guanine nucleotide exchange factor 14-like isoform X2 [Lotus japonicus]XP_057448814.1 rop guanine nucleotide exchange factor 14-like isoform X2 [Lotus japonicus]
MLTMRKRLACCTRERTISIDFDQQQRIMTYNGLESCILNNQSYEEESRTSRGDGCITDSFDEDDSSCSSSKDASGSFSSNCLRMKRDEKGLEEWKVSQSPQRFYAKEKKPAYVMQHSDIEAMKEKFSKLLLGEDVTGGTKGLSTALALSNAITNLAVTVFGELWKLEPLCEERKNKWRREMEWLLSPTNYMVELVPAKQISANGGRIFEIMTPKARADIHMNLPALQKLDSMLIEALDSMVDTEFWYAEGGSRAEGRNSSARHSQRWWLPSPQVPKNGLSDTERLRLLHQRRVVRQIFKAAKSINENVLLEMPVPAIIKDALAKSGKTNLGQELHKVLLDESSNGEDMLKSLNLKSEHIVLETINRLEAAIFSLKEKITEQVSRKSPARTSWSFVKDSLSEVDKMGLLMDRAETLLQLLKIRFPNLPPTFLDATKVQYGKDIGHSILEAYSRVLGNLAFSILSRIRDILQEDSFSNPNSPAAAINLSETWVVGSHVRHSLLDKMNKANGQCCDSSFDSTSDLELSIDAKSSVEIATPSRSSAWCISREACTSVSPQNSP